MWWNFNKQLTDNAVQRIGLPALRDSNGAWVHDAKRKADMFSASFAAKFTLPPEMGNFTCDNPTDIMCNFTVIRRRWTLRFLKDLRVSQPTAQERSHVSYRLQRLTSYLHVVQGRGACLEHGTDAFLVQHLFIWFNSMGISKTVESH